MTASIAARGNSGGGDGQVVTVAIRNCRRPVGALAANAAEITGSAVPAPGSRKMRPLD